ncbi:MAG: PAS domain S-box protein [Leptospira sp.]|nr:PAS domain S-box protein [Leptospira sp.]
MVNSDYKKLIDLHNIIDSAMDAVISINADFKVILFNKAAESMFGFSSDEMMGNTLHCIIPDDTKSIHDDILRRFIKRSENKINLNTVGNIRGQRRNGEIFPMEAAISKLNSDDQLILTVILRDISDRYKAEEKIKTLLYEKEHLLKEIHHRVKNNLFTIFTLLELQANESTIDIVKNSLHDASSRVRSMMTLYEKIYQKTTDIQKINLSEYLPSLINDIVSIFPSPTPVEIITQIQDIEIDIKIASPLGIILNELITNTMKYAFVKSGDRKITVTAEMIGPLNCIIFKDNGIGIPETIQNDRGTSFGLQMIEILVAQINGKIEFLNDLGTKIVIHFPK